MKKTIAALAVLLAAALTLTACGSDDPSDGVGSGSASAHNDADVSFAQQMIPHHEQAVQMATMARTRAASPEVRRLASDIEGAQGPEISTMKKWLESWGEDVPGGSMDHMDMGHGTSSEMPGMMDEQQMGQLEGASGAAFDRMFLTMMIDHHEGAIEMARTEQTDGRDADAVALAKRIEEAQTAEIATMKGLLGS